MLNQRTRFAQGCRNHLAFLHNVRRGVGPTVPAEQVRNPVHPGPRVTINKEIKNSETKMTKRKLREKEKSRRYVKVIVDVRLSVLTRFITTADAYIYKYLHYRTRCTLSNIGIHGPDVTLCGALRYSLSSAGRSGDTIAPTDNVEPSVVFRTTREGRESNVIFRSGFSSIRSTIK